MSLKAWLENRARAGKNSGHPSVKFKPAKLIVACPVCSLGESSPEKFVNVGVNANTKIATCRLGHRFPVGGKSY